MTQITNIIIAIISLVCSVTLLAAMERLPHHQLDPCYGRPEASHSNGQTRHVRINACYGGFRSLAVMGVVVAQARCFRRGSTDQSCKTNSEGRSADGHQDAHSTVGSLPLGQKGGSRWKS